MTRHQRHRRGPLLATLALWVLGGALGCSGEPDAAPADVGGLDETTTASPADVSGVAEVAVAAPDVPPLGPRPVPPPTYTTSRGRVVAMGDVHGDLNALRQALGLAGLIDAEGRWVGAETVLVQVGDQLDRGDNERAILDWLETLADEAHAAGGAVHILLGNHETMNVGEDFRYVTDGGWADFEETPYDPSDPRLAGYPVDQRGRVAAFLPGGPYARVLAGHNIAAVVDDTVFVHGGLLPSHIAPGLERLNADVSAWMRGDAPRPAVLSGDDSPVWSRHYSKDVDPTDCALLREALDGVPAKRMVVAHTVQSEGISSECDGLVWRVDVGLASYYGGSTQVLQIIDGVPQVLR